MTHMRRATRWLVLGTLCPLSACESDGRATGLAGLPEWTLGAAPLLTVGQAEGESAEVFSGVAGVLLLPGGQLLVADRGSGNLRIFDAAGRLARQMGGRGEGPGEFQYVSSVLLVPPDTVAVYDTQLYRLTKFHLEGRVAATQPFHASDGYPEFYLGTYSDGHHALAWIKQTARNRSIITADLMRIGQFGREGQQQRIVGEVTGMRRLGSPVPFSPHFLGTMAGDTVFYSNGLDGEVRAVGPDGGMVRIWRVPGDALPFDVAWDNLEAALDSTDRRELERVAPRAGIDTIPTISDLLKDDKGLLWVKRYAPSTDSHWVARRRTGGEWLVLTTTGAPVARVEVPKGFRPMEVRGNRIAGVTRDEWGVERAVVFGLSHVRPAP